MDNRNETGAGTPMTEERRIEWAEKITRETHERAQTGADLILHGAAQGLVDEGIASPQDATRFVAEAMIAEILDHGFALRIDTDGNARLTHEYDAPKPRPLTRLNITTSPPRIEHHDPGAAAWVPDGLLDAAARALRLAAAALHAMPAVESLMRAEHQSARAAALVTVQAAVALLEGRPFDPHNTDLMSVLRRARDGLAILIAGDRPDAPLAGLIRQTWFEIVQMIGPAEFSPGESLRLEDIRAAERDA